MKAGKSNQIRNPSQTHDEEGAEDQGIVVDAADHAKEGAADEQSVRLKLNLNLDLAHPLAKAYQALKDKGVKSPDLSLMVTAALKEVNESWWNAQTDALIPLDIKIQEALRNPAMREKLNDFFSSALQQH